MHLLIYIHYEHLTKSYPCCVTDINFVTVNGVMMGLKRQKKIIYVNFVLQVVVNFMTACKL